jgi:hypothetical protein
MNEPKARQGEGYDFYDFASINFNAGGGAEVAYVAGANARAAVLGLLLDAAIWPISETLPAVPPIFPGLGVPHDAQDTHFYASQPCLLRLVNRNTIMRWILALAAGAPWSAWPIPVVQIQLRANVDYVYPDKWAVLYVVAQAAQQAGTLMVKASG